MERLRAAGAPIHCRHPERMNWADPEGEFIYGPFPLTMTRETVRVLAGDFFISSGSRALQVFLRWLVDENPTGEGSVAALLRRYPWIPRVYEATRKKKERAEAHSFLLEA